MSTIDQQVAVPEGFAYDPYSDEAMSNPLPFYDVLREHFPVYYIEKYDLFCLSRFEYAWEMLSLTDNAIVASEGQQPPASSLLTHNTGPVPDVSHRPLTLMNFQRYPVYEQIRQAVGRPMRPRAIEKLGDFIREQAIARLDELLPRGQFDLTRDFAGILGATTICHMFRLPLTEAPQILDNVNESSRTDVPDDPDGPSLVERMIANSIGVVEPLVTARRKAGWDGSWMLVDGMLDARIAGHPMTDREIAETLAVEIMIGGTETVPKVIGHGLWELQKRPEQLAAVRADVDGNARQAWNEMVRYCGPAQHFMRTVNKPIVIGGQAMRPGQRVNYLLPACARDPREYGEDAGDFRWDREIKRLLNFGHGQKFCLGVHLANLEGTILVQEFLRRVADFEVDEAGAVRRPSTFQWGWNEIPITVATA